MVKTGSYALFEAGAKPGLIARSGVRVNDSLLCCFVDEGNGFSERGLGLGRIARLDGSAKFPQCGAKAGLIDPVLSGSRFSLAGALQRRKMICHVAVLVL